MGKLPLKNWCRVVLKDEEILATALMQYAVNWRGFATYLRTPGATDPNGDPPTDLMMDEAQDMADRAELLAARAIEKAESPIILLQ